MFRLLGNPKPVCSGLTRRELLVASGVGLGQSLAGPPTRAGDAGAETPVRAKSVICLFLFGGWSQYETFDPKPDAPAEIRGPYQAIPSSLPGFPVCEHLPQMAQRMDRVALVRSVTSDDANHNTSLILTGRHATNGGTATKGFNPGIPFDWPFFMSALQSTGSPAGRPGGETLPNNLCLPNRLGLLEGYWRTGPYAGFLGPRFDPICTQFGKNGEPLFQPGGVRADSLSFTPTGAALGPQMSLDQLSRRTSLLEQLDAARGDLLRSKAIDKYTRSQQQSLDLLTSERFRAALDLSREDPATRDRYGWNLFGQSVLTARRLVEAGVPLTTAIWDCTKESQDISLLSWDTHWDHFKACEGWLLPGFDRALAALLDDLKDRGLFEETLVVVLSEMGRTPRINSRAGRDHWVGTYPALFAGAGIQPGTVYGRSDATGSYVAENPVQPIDLLATAYHLCGVGAESTIRDHLNRPLSLYGDGAHITGILA
ncbi:MAG: DUF1501 domain-containing protein [Planctomycetota bacterium]|nr:DUF1501 domain-containing protein [Planctomycetota bacterium]